MPKTTNLTREKRQVYSVKHETQRQRTNYTSKTKKKQRCQKNATKATTIKPRQMETVCKAAAKIVKIIAKKRTTITIELPGEGSKTVATAIAQPDTINIYLNGRIDGMCGEKYARKMNPTLQKTVAKTV